ncbi:MAG: hypothetical protein M1813_004980 [Trichoglossum hirsutum]|jgi:hypothetical protein|nr:MAG: hypothetical protein M1813_004980 [Trichoglossum hirsutum]
MTSKAGTFFIVFFVLLIVFAIAYVAYTQLRARRLGLPPPTLSSYNPFRALSSSSSGYPSPRSGGPLGWITDKYNAFRNRRGPGGGGGRTAGGAYEGAGRGDGGGGGGGSRGFGPLDPDEAWDARVGNEADAYGPGGYYEEQELGLHPPPNTSTAYRSTTVTSPPLYDTTSPPRGRSRSRDPPGPGHHSQNPFDDSAATQSNISLRGVGPMPAGGGGGHRGGARGDDEEGERRSIFREDVT